MKKKAGEIIAICCAFVFGIFVGKEIFFVSPANDVVNSDAEANKIIEQDVSFSSDIKTDILTRHALPDLERMEVNDQDQYVNNKEVIKRLELLGIEKNSILYPELKLSDVEEEVNGIFTYDREINKIAQP